MRLRSLCRHGYQFTPITVEVSLLPGIPQLQILGLPDAMIREAALRVKSALRAQGFRWPRTQKIVVNLSPAHFPKSSQGLDLPIAVGILLATEQISWPAALDKTCFWYGEMSLFGEVQTPQDLAGWQATEVMVSGEGSLACPSYPLARLGDLREVGEVRPGCQAQVWQRPGLPLCKWNMEQAHLFKIIATGLHHTLLVGPPGSGKTIFCENVLPFLPPPDVAHMEDMLRLSHFFAQPLTWRPFLAPHHSATPLAVVGGGHPLAPGEITRAHGGILFLDEFLEFSPNVQDALREPLQSGNISLVRAGERARFPAQFTLLATSNLCRCGGYQPNNLEPCRCSRAQIQTYQARLRGPFLDRFEIVFFTQEWLRLPRLTSSDHVLQEIEGRHAEGEPLMHDVALEKGFAADELSMRRRQAWLRVAKTLARIDGSRRVTLEHLHQSWDLSVRPFQMLQKAL